MSLGSSVSFALDNPGRLPNHGGDNRCPECGRTFHRDYEECPACGTTVANPMLA